MTSAALARLETALDAVVADSLKQARLEKLGPL
jgi:hypothetical protein